MLKRFRSLIITILLVVAANMAISYASTVPALPNSPRPKSTVPALPNSPRPKSNVIEPSNSLMTKSTVPALPNSPRP